MSEFTKCEHDICNCPSSGDDNFCGDHCREVTEQEIAEIICDCGCPGCKNSLA